MKAIPAAAPTDIVKALVNQKQPPSTAHIRTFRQHSGSGVLWESIPLILHLPDQPIGRRDPPDPKAFVLILRIAMPHSIDESLMQTEFDPLTGLITDNRLRQQLEQR